MEKPKVIQAEVTVATKNRVINWTETDDKGNKSMFEILITPTRIIYSKFNTLGDITERGETELDHTSK